MSNWNGKIATTYICSNFKRDKIYEINNGVICDEDGNKYGIFTNVNDLNSRMTSVKFKEIIEEVKVPVLCELLGVLPNERFKVKFSDNCKIDGFFINKDGYLHNKEQNLVSSLIPDLLNKKCKLIKLSTYQFDENELIILKVLKLNNYNYMARNKNNDLWAYEKLPEEASKCYYSTGEYCILNKDFFKQIQFGNILDIKQELLQK